MKLTLASFWIWLRRRPAIGQPSEQWKSDVRRIFGLYPGLFSKEFKAHVERLFSGDLVYIRDSIRTKEQYESWVGSEDVQAHPFYVQTRAIFFHVRGSLCAGMTDSQPCIRGKHATLLHHVQYPGVLGIEILRPEMMRRICGDCHDTVHVVDRMRDWTLEFTRELVAQRKMIHEIKRSLDLEKKA